MPLVEIATDQGRRRLSWDSGRITVGRLASNDIVVPSKHVSRAHAELTYANGHVWITDLASGYGVWVGERRVTTYEMPVGQPVRIAPDVHLILIESAPDPAAQPTTHLPALPSQPLEEQPTRMRLPAAPPGAASGQPGHWLRATEPTVWAPRDEPESLSPPHAPRRPTPDFAGFEDEHDGDVFRRQATNPNANAPATTPRAGQPTARLVACATCGERNPLGAVTCHGCGHSLALPCVVCGLSLLAAQDRCPRCHTPNTGFSGRIL
ncbi:MAG TPA: FHA domain-containing protein [Ktedonobacterales bacterium]|nr:FHA domain-containing protein [Ktedonobacterales bacterium]